MRTMQSPATAAASIMAWFGFRSLATMNVELPRLTADHPVLHAARIIADAANSDDERLRGDGLSALFSGLIEPLNDSFTPAGRAVYARVFGHLVWHIAQRTPALISSLSEFGVSSESALLARHQRLRTQPSAPPATANKIVVLSRVTIGADILLSSVVLQRVRQKYPAAEIVLLGDGKLAGLFGGMSGVRVRALSYARRGPLQERLLSWLTVRDAIREENPDLVIAPDSRLDQLGLLPVCAENKYLLWENTQAEDHECQSLALLLDGFLSRHFALPATPVILPRVSLAPAVADVRKKLQRAFGSAPLVAVKLDHGGNPAKSLPRAGEIALLKELQQRGWRILLDRGFGNDELINSDALISAMGWTAYDIDDSGKGLGQPLETLSDGQLAQNQVIRFHGSIAGWAAALACCQHAVSYDSVGHHLAGALGVPVTVIFTGFSDPGFPIAWGPQGQARIDVVVIPTDEKNQPSAWKNIWAVLPDGRAAH
jgi:ADP-heptose:LPS heptosyltransferase